MAVGILEPRSDGSDGREQLKSGPSKVHPRKVTVIIVNHPACCQFYRGLNLRPDHTLAKPAACSPSRHHAAPKLVALVVTLVEALVEALEVTRQAS